MHDAPLRINYVDRLLMLAGAARPLRCQPARQAVIPRINQGQGMDIGLSDINAQGGIGQGI